MPRSRHPQPGLVRAGVLAAGDPLDYAWEWFDLVKLGLARYVPLDEFVPLALLEDESFMSQADRVIRTDGDGALVRMRGTSCPKPEFYPQALAAFTPSTDDPDLAPMIAEWLHAERGKHEQQGALSASCWCVGCGRRFVDRRHSRGLVAIAAKWCGECRRSRTRHLEALRLCGAHDCFTYFRPTRANQVFHSHRCKQAARGWTGPDRAKEPVKVPVERWAELCGVR